MAAATAGRRSISAKAYLARYHADEEYVHPLHLIHEEWPEYEIPVHPRRSQRTTTIMPPPKKMRLCSGTIVVVPPNLIHQWEAEIKRHVVPGELKVLVMKDSSDRLPSADMLMNYDIILFSKNRFQKEDEDGSDVKVCLRRWQSDTSF